MIDPQQALALVLQVAAACPPRRVPLAAAGGLTLAQSVRADRDYPPFPRATMDGFAVRTADAGRSVKVVGEVAAGQDVQIEVTAGNCLEIMTGAPCPPGTEAVVKKEETSRHAAQVVLPARILAGQNIAPRGSECQSGRLVLESGQTLTPLAVAVLASFGLGSVEVVPRPSLAIITTGAELVSLNTGETPVPLDLLGPAQIRDSNGPMLRAMARELGIEQPALLHAEDRLEAIVETLEQAADQDLVLLTGGVSAGRYDLVPDALQSYGAECTFHKVAQKPGKPLLLARRGRQLFFGLPGNPLSCHLCFHRYVAAAVRQMEGKPPLCGPFRGQLAEALRPRRNRTFFVQARAESLPQGPAAWQIRPLLGASSADMFACHQANCYVEVPPGETPVPAGAVLEFTWLGPGPWTG
jgi:molybdenum cofactor synthesis domain-containing protein